MNETKLVVFDLDGTLLNTIGDLSAAMNHTLRGRGYPEHSEAECQTMVGHGIRNFMKAALESGLQLDDAMIDDCLAEFKAYYADHIAEKTRPYPGIHELLRELQSKGIAIAVASNKFQSGAEKLLGLLFPDIKFAAIIGNRKDLPLKPDPRVISMVCDSTGIPAANTVMVGDSSTDMKTARNAGVRGIAVSWGFRPKSALTDADVIVDCVAELRRCLFLS